MGYPKMDGENDGTPYENSMDLGGKKHFFGGKHPYILNGLRFPFVPLAQPPLLATLPQAMANQAVRGLQQP